MKLSEYLQIALGIFLTSVGLKAFLLPNGFLDGGATGSAILLSKLTGLNISIGLVLVSIPFLILGFFKLSRKLVIRSIFSILILAFIIHLEHFPVVTEDKLLIAIFGGLFVGSGIGISIRNGAVLDASEILGIFIYNKFSISIGKVVIVFNLILFSATAIFVSLEAALYSVLTFIVTAKVIDFFIEGFEDFIGVMIVTTKTQELKERIIEDLGTGLTIFHGESGYGKKGHEEAIRIFQTVVNRIDLRKINRIIEDVDENAFVVEFDVNNVKGGITQRYLEKANLSKPVH